MKFSFKFSKKKFFLVTLIVLAICNVAIWQKVFALERSDDLLVVFLDVGQGDAIFIEAPNGNQVLVDSGPDKSILRELGEVMGFSDRSIDLVIATHPDADHIGGFPDVFDRYEIATVMHPGATSDTATFKEFVNKMHMEGSDEIIGRQGMVVDLGSGVTLNILFPDRDGLDGNEASIVAKLIYGETEFLLTGDAPIATERILLSERIDVKSDVLKAGHHGSRTSTSEPFLKAVSSSIVIISAGKDNRYGHPHEEVIDRLNAFGAKIFSTAELGRIKFYSDGTYLYQD